MKINALKKGDFFVFALILFVTFLILWKFTFGQIDGQYGEVYQDNVLIKKVRLQEGYRDKVEIKGKDITNIVEIDGKRMRFVEANCYDEVCVDTGWISKTGQIAVCLPNRAIIKITGQTSNDDIDVFVG